MFYNGGTRRKIYLSFIAFSFIGICIIGCGAEKNQKTSIEQETVTAIIPEDNGEFKQELPFVQDSFDGENTEGTTAAGLTYSGSFINTGRVIRPLPSNGVNAAELNPANYQKLNREVMEAMGMAPHYVAYLAGEKTYREGDYEAAISEYSRSISLKADYADAYVSRGNAQRRKGDLKKAIEDYDRALALKRDYTEVYNYRGFVYAKMGEIRRAIEDYTQAIRYKADYTDAYFNRAYAHAELGNWDMSIADYTQVIKLEPSNWVAYIQRGNAWYGKGDKTRAAEDYAAAEKLQGAGQLH